MNIPKVDFKYDPPVKPRGPADARILIVGEAPGKNEIEAGLPFVGHSGQELANMLREAGIDPDQCRYTNVVNYRPENNQIANFFASSKKRAAEIGAIGYAKKYALPLVYAGIAELREEIRRVRPNVVIAAGNASLWACTGQWGITNWRGSEMQRAIDDVRFKCIPIIHPAGILRNWAWRWHTVVDLRRAARESAYPELRAPNFNFLIRPSYGAVVDYLLRLRRQVIKRPTKLAVDIETRNRHVACVGLAPTATDAICIPFMSVMDSEGCYWTHEEEANIWWLLYKLLTHKNCRVVGQNFLYDNQYFVRRAGFACNITDDTMTKMHVCFPGVPKSLAFISSIFCDFHCFWKDDGKEWVKNMDEDLLWQYNCRDAVATFEADQKLDAMLDTFGLRPQYDERRRTSRTAFKMMLRGVDVSMPFKQQLYKDCALAINQRKEFLIDVLGFDIFGPKGGVSPPKMKMLCYQLFQLPAKYRIDPATKQRRLSCDKDAIDEWLMTCDPIFRPILKMIKDVRSLSVFKGTFAGAPLDWDQRFRCSNNVDGPHTFRWSTSEDAFGFGTNLQNIPKGDER